MKHMSGALQSQDSSTITWQPSVHSVRDYKVYGPSWYKKIDTYYGATATAGGLSNLGLSMSDLYYKLTGLIAYNH